LFSDAPEDTHTAVVYLSATYSSEATTVSLVAVKTQVAPIKSVFIPHHEVCGALLLMLYTLTAVLHKATFELIYWWWVEEVSQLLHTTFIYYTFINKTFITYQGSLHKLLTRVYYIIRFKTHLHHHIISMDLQGLK